MWQSLSFKYFSNLNYTNRFASTLARWTGPGTSFDEPRVTFVDSNNNNRASDRYIEDGSYLRIKNIQFGYSYYTQILDESGNLLYIEVEDGCLEGIFVNYLEDDDNIDSPEDIDYDCVWNEAEDLMYYIGGFFDTELKSLSLDEFLVEYSDILNRTMKNDIMFLLRL